MSVVPFRDAASCAVASEDTAPALAVKLADVAPDEKFKLPGTVTPRLLEANVAVRPAAGAACESVAVQVDAAGVNRTDGEQENPVKIAAETRFTVAVRVTPAAVAVITALWLLTTVPAVPVNVPLVIPWAMVTEAAVDRIKLLSLNDTGNPPAGAVFVSVTVQVVVAPEPRLLGEQATDDSCAGACRLKLELTETPL